MLVTEDLDEATVERAGPLVAREHAAARQVRPELPAGFGGAGFRAAACSAHETAAITARSRPATAARRRS